MKLRMNDNKTKTQRIWTSCWSSWHFILRFSNLKWRTILIDTKFAWRFWRRKERLFCVFVKADSHTFNVLRSSVQCNQKKERERQISFDEWRCENENLSSNWKFQLISTDISVDLNQFRIDRWRNGRRKRSRDVLRVWSSFVKSMLMIDGNHWRVKFNDIVIECWQSEREKKRREMINFDERTNDDKRTNVEFDSEVDRRGVRQVIFTKDFSSSFSNQFIKIRKISF